MLAMMSTNPARRRARGADQPWVLAPREPLERAAVEDAYRE